MFKKKVVEVIVNETRDRVQVQWRYWIWWHRSKRTDQKCLLAVPLLLHLLLNNAGQLATCRQRMLAQVTSQRNLVVSDEVETSGGSAPALNSLAFNALRAGDRRVK
jgi:hypothetical protein